MKTKTIDLTGQQSRQGLRSDQESSETVTQKFEEFHISVTPVGEDEYLVRTEQAPKGVLPAEEQVTWPVEDWLRQARYLMDDPLLGLLRQRAVNPVADCSVRGTSDTLEGQPSSPEVGRSPSRNMSEGRSLNLVSLGQEFYNALFQGTLRQRLGEAQAIAHNRGNVLRLRLGLKGNRLPRLPWEVLHEDSRPIATGTDVVFSRYQPTLAPLALPAAAINQPLKILMVLAAPTDQENLALKQEARHLREELQRRVSYRNGQGNSAKDRRWLSGGSDRATASAPEFELDILEQPDREKLTRTLEQGQYQVLHYAGHSNLGPAGGELYLVSERTGLTEVLTGDDLAGLLVNTGIRMAVFNSCRGTYTATSDPTDATGGRNLAEVLVKRGVPGVLAMAERIPDDVALTLTRLLYYNLTQGYPVDLSLSRARQGLISAYGSHQMYWALPVLYLHPEFDGYLSAYRTDATEIPADYYGIPRQGLGIGGAANLQEATLPISAEKILSSDPDYYDEDFDELDDEGMEGGFDDLIDDELAEDDPDEEDAAFVSNLFRELATGGDNREKSLLPEASAQSSWLEEDNASARLDTYQQLAGNPRKEPTPAALDKETLVSPANPEKQTAATSYNSSQQLKSQTILPRAIDKVWPVVGAVAIAIVALLGVAAFRGGFFSNRTQQVELAPVATPQPKVEDLNEIDFQKASTRSVTAIAIELFNQGDLPGGQEAVEALLDRGALTQAKGALLSVPKKLQNEPAINFLLGRLNWQGFQTGNKEYSLYDARRFWETAVQQKPKTPVYYNALGFAFYAEGQLNRASDMWLKVVTLLEETPAISGQPAATGKQVSTSTTLVPTQPALSEDYLTAHAGLALVRMKSAFQQTQDPPNTLLSKAIKQHKMVMAYDPVNFTADALSKNWMWTKESVKDWQQLPASKVKNK